MQKQSNTGWWVLSAIALLGAIGYQVGNNRGKRVSVDNNSAPDTAAGTDIIITSSKP